MSANGPGADAGRVWNSCETGLWRSGRPPYGTDRRKTD